MINVRPILTILLCFKIAQSKADSRSELLSTLFDKYDNHVWPQTNGSSPIDIVLDLTIINARLNEATAVLGSHVWLVLTWNDPRLSWSSETSSIDYLHVDKSRLWTPTICAREGVRPEEVDDDVGIMVSRNGNIFWIVTATFFTSCSSTPLLSFWPESSHKCKFSLGTWNPSRLYIHTFSYDNSSLELDMSSFETTTHALVSAVAKTSSVKTDSDLERGWQGVEIELELERNEFIHTKFIAVLIVFVLPSLLLIAWCVHPSLRSRDRLAQSFYPNLKTSRLQSK